MRIKKSTITVLYNICKAINMLLAIPLVLIIDFSFSVALEEIKLWKPISRLLLRLLYAFDIVFIIIEYPFIILFDKLVKILSKNIDTTQPVLTQNEMLAIPFHRYHKKQAKDAV